MDVFELSHEQMEELKQAYLCEHLLEVEDRTPSWGELALADEIVSNTMIFEQYAGVIFSEDDFFCTMGTAK